MMEKNDIAGVLDEIATFMELTGENPFKIRAYSAGARILENMTEDLGELIDSGKLADIPGLGEALVDKITTLRRDGVLPFHQKLKASIPAGLLEVMQIPGLGPKKVRALWTQLSVEDLAKLKEVCESGAVAELKGFGEKTQEKILEGIKNRIAYGKRHRWYEAAAIAEPILAGLLFLRDRMRQYIADRHRLAEQTGVPILTPMFFHFPDDAECWAPGSETQFVVGGDWLVAPVSELNATSRSVFFPTLPSGEHWVPFYDGLVPSPQVDGGQRLDVTFTIATFPLFRRSSLNLTKWGI